MNTALTYNTVQCTDKTYRRTSTETVLSVQDKDTDCVADTSDTEILSSNEQDVEYEPVTESENDKPAFDDTTDDSEDEIIKTNVITVTMGDDGELEFADSEQTEANESDSEIDLLGYDKCARCNSSDISTFYRYCTNCFKARKNLFPPRPRRKHKSKNRNNKHARQCVLPRSNVDIPHSLSQDSGIESLNSQKSKDGSDCDDDGPSEAKVGGHSLKRHASAEPDLAGKKRKLSYDTDTPLVKSVSEPAASIQLSMSDDTKDNLCIICYTHPKTGVFAHGKLAHICCCYKCAVKVWNTSKRCPLCNCKVSNVLKAVM